MREGAKIAAVSFILFLLELLGYWLSRPSGDLATLALYVASPAVGILVGRNTASRLAGFTIAFLCCATLALANLYFLSWLQLGLFERMDLQVFEWFLPVYIWVLLVPSVLGGAIAGAIVARKRAE